MSNVQMVQDLYEAFGQGDVPTVLGAMDADTQWREAEGNPYQLSGEAWIGPDAILQNLFVKLGSEWDGFTVHPKDFHDAGDTVVVEGRYTGTNKATGKNLDAQYCHVFKIRDGKLGSFHSSWTRRRCSGDGNVLVQCAAATAVTAPPQPPAFSLNRFPSRMYLRSTVVAPTPLIFSS